MDTRYESLPSLYEQKATPLTEEAEKPASAWRRSFLCMKDPFTQLLGLLWLAPIVLLLYLNFKGHIIGPGALCPAGGCKVDPLAYGNSKWALYLNRQDHNILGTLQLVAKALELWFLFVAVNFVYKIAMLVASREEGLPIGLFSSPVEFADPRSLYQISRAVMVTTARPRTKQRSGANLPLYLFVILLGFMCLLVNLMGPAVAVLVLPTLQWVSLPEKAQHSFNVSAIGSAPNGADFEVFPYCSNANLTRRLYSCTSLPYASSLDSWADILNAGPAAYDSPLFGVSAENDVSFAINISISHDFAEGLWTPNRQTLREISADLRYFMQGSQNISANPGYRTYNQSLNTILKRKGPVFSSVMQAFIPENTTNTRLGIDKEVRCYGGYESVATHNRTYTKCLRVGPAWNPLNTEANFKIAAYPNSSFDSFEVQVFFSDRAAHFNGAFDVGLIPSSCFINGTSTSSDNCDFDAVFASNGPLPLASSASSSNLLYVEVSMPQESPGRKLVFEFLTFMDFATYTLDTSPQTNPLYLVELDNLPDIKQRGLRTIPVNPDWFLAAWSVDQDGLIADRSAALSLVQGFHYIFEFYSSQNYTIEDVSGDGDQESTQSTTARTAIVSSTVTDTEIPFSSPVDSNTDSPFKTADATSESWLGSAETLLRRQPESYESTTTSSNEYYDFLPTASATSAQATSETYSVSSWPTASLSPSTDEKSSDIDQFFLDFLDTDGATGSTEVIVSTNLVLYSHLQMLSLVPYSKINLTQQNRDTKDPQHPTLWYWAQVHVWAYGTESRTSKLGIVVTMVGGVCVILSTVLGVVKRRRQRSFTDFLIAAVKYTHQGELSRPIDNKHSMDKTRYRICEDNQGKIHFSPL